MPSAPNRSSKEWKASALEKVRKAEADAATVRQYQRQLEALQAQIKQAAENEKRNNEEAALERQQARDEEFRESSLIKQGAFRNKLADEVLTRVAQSLKTDDDHKYIIAVTENRPGFENPTELQAMLWKAIAGDDAGYLRQLAHKISERYGVPITDDSLNAIANSLTCLDHQAPLPLHHPQVEAPENADQSITEITDELIAERNKLNMVIEEHIVLERRESMKKIEPGEVVKTPEKRNAMDMIETASNSRRSETIADYDTDIVLRDPLGKIITGEDEFADQHPNEQGPAQVTEPQIPASASRKRSFLDNDGTSIPSETGSARKKRQLYGKPKYSLVPTR